MKKVLFSRTSILESDEKLVELNKLSKEQRLIFANDKQYKYFTSLGAYKIDDIKSLK